MKAKMDDSLLARLPKWAQKYIREVEANRDTMVAALRAAEQLHRDALPKFNWGASALDAHAIGLLNEVPRTVQNALESAPAAQLLSQVYGRAKRPVSK